MNVIGMLKQDHRQVDSLMQQLEEGGDQSRLFGQLKEALTVHSRFEETVLYPALKAEPATGEQVEHSYEEHAKVDDILNRMAGEVGTDAFSSSLAELKENVQHHVD